MHRDKDKKLNTTISHILGIKCVEDNADFLLLCSFNYIILLSTRQHRCMGVSETFWHCHSLYCSLVLQDESSHVEYSRRKHDGSGGWRVHTDSQLGLLQG